MLRHMQETLSIEGRAYHRILPYVKTRFSGDTVNLMCNITPRASPKVSAAGTVDSRAMLAIWYG